MSAMLVASFLTTSGLSSTTARPVPVARARPTLARAARRVPTARACGVRQASSSTSRVRARAVQTHTVRCCKNTISAAQNKKRNPLYQLPDVRYQFRHSRATGVSKKADVTLKPRSVSRNEPSDSASG